MYIVYMYMYIHVYRMTNMIQIVGVSIVITPRGKGVHMHVIMTDCSVFSSAYKRYVGPASL